MNIAHNHVVSIQYILTNDEGMQIDASTPDKPLLYLQGAGNIIPGLESALLDKQVGDDFKVTVQPQQGYGEFKPDLVQEVPIEAFEKIENLREGMQLKASGPEGQVQILVVKNIGDESATVDGNHPLADQILHFAVKVEAIRDATNEELEHGHAHE